jgi:D-tyrosyl-tRNA(Tyr) deacylase
MNISLIDANFDILLVSQFTLFASTKKGNRPSYIKASRPEFAIPLYAKMIAKLEELLGKKIATGLFGADMNISLTNNGPVTIMIDSKLKVGNFHYRLLLVCGLVSHLSLIKIIIIIR